MDGSGGKQSLRWRTYAELDPRMSRHMSWANGVVIVIILLGVMVTVAETEPAVIAGRELQFAYINFGFGILFLIEYLLRLWSIAERDPARPWRARLEFMGSFASIIDLLAIISSLDPLLGFNSTPLRLIRAARIFRLGRVGPIAEAMHILGTAIASRRYELLTTLGIALVTLLLGATVMYWAEGHIQPKQFGSIPRAMWWAVVTLTTVGYGDVYPITPIGKLVASLVALAGIGVIVLPTGIMASAFNEALHDHHVRSMEAREAAVAKREAAVDAKLP